MTRITITTLALIALLPSSAFAQLGNKKDSPIEISADNSLEWHQDENQYTAKGNAIATQDDKKIQADILNAHYTPSENGDTEITRITAQGNVIITTATDKAFGENGEYDVVKELVTLTGNVRVERDQNILNGDRATVDLKTGISKMLSDKKGGRVTGKFFPESKK